MLSGKSFTLYVIVLLLNWPMSVFAESAGVFLFVFGKVQIVNQQGQSTEAAKGMSINAGDTIVAAANGKAQIKMQDGGFMGIRPNTELQIETFITPGENKNARSVMSLIKGTFRTISGAIAGENPDQVLVKTPVATIGIRGTDHEPAFIPANDPVYGSIKPGLYDKVNLGKVLISNNNGELLLGRNDVGFVGLSNQTPVRLEQLPAFYNEPNVSLDSSEESADEVASSSESSSEENNDSATETEAGLAENTGSDNTAEATTEESLSLAGGSTDSVVVGAVFTPVIQPEVSSNTVTAVSFIQFDPQAGSQASQSAYDPFQRIEETHLANNLRDTILRSSDGHVIGAVDDKGVTHEVRGIISKTAIKQSNHYAQNGIEMGMLSAQTLYDSDVSWDQTGDLENRYWGWITGPSYLGGPITGTIDMVFDGGIAYQGNLDGSTWSQVNFNATGNSLKVDFTNQKVDVNLSAGNWKFSSGMSFDSSGAFSAQLNNLQVDYNGSTANTYGSVSGSLTGAADGAVVSFAAKETNAASASFCSSCTGITGVAAFDKP